MKKLLRVLLCAALAAGALTASAFAAEGEPPPLQGDFYVLVNGEYVTFPDAVPRLKDGRSFLPFVAVFGQLGFAEEDMTWDASTATVTAEKEGVFISLTQGSKSITVEREGETTVYEVDVAPYIDAATSRTYIPFGLAAEVLGYNVGWDAVTGTVIIDDGLPVEHVAAEDGPPEVPAYDKYTTYVLGSSALILDDIGDPHPYEVDRDPAKNAGTDMLYVRDRFICGAAGLSFEKPSSITASASNADLATGTNWVVCNNGTTAIDHRAIPIARIISRG